MDLQPPNLSILTTMSPGSPRHERLKITNVFFRPSRTRSSTFCVNVAPDSNGIFIVSREGDEVNSPEAGRVGATPFRGSWLHETCVGGAPVCCRGWFGTAPIRC